MTTSLETAKPNGQDPRPGENAGMGRQPGQDAGGPGRRRAPGAQPESDREALYTFVKSRLAGPEPHDEVIQYELARWVDLLETTEDDLKAGQRSKSEVLRRLVREAGAAIPALLSAKPDLVFARTLRVQTEIDLLRHNGPTTRTLLWLTGGSPVLTICLGSLAALLVGITCVALWLQDLESLKALAPLDAHVPTAIAAAFLGGLVSVVARMQGFARLGDFEHLFLFINALARPFMGAIFGVFAYAALRSGFIPLDKELLASITPYQVWALGFVAGFSERFAKDLISRGEGMLSKPKTS